MNFCDKLQILRKKASLTQDELALKLGVSRQAVSKWESGNALPDLNNAQALCRLFEISLDTLLNPQVENLLQEPQKGLFDIRELGNNIKKQRNAKQIAQEVFAEQLGGSRQSVSKWENGDAIPKTELLIAMLSIFDICFDGLVSYLPLTDGIAEAISTSSKTVVDPAPVTENTLPVKKKKRLLWLWILLGTVSAALIAAAVLGWILISPFLDAKPFENALDAVLPNTANLQKLPQQWKDRGITVTVGGTHKLNLTLQANEDSIAIGGYGENCTPVLIPRKNIKAALQTSIFHYESNSHYALQQSDYEKLEKAVELISSDPADNALRPAIKEIANTVWTDLTDGTEPIECYELVKGELALRKRVTYCIDKQKVLNVLNTAYDEINKNENLNLYFYEPYVSEIKLTDSIGELKKELQNNTESLTVSLSYTVYRGKLETLSLLLEGVGKEKESSNSEIVITFLHGPEETGIDAVITTNEQVDQDRFASTVALNYRIQDTDKLLKLAVNTKTEDSYHSGTAGESYSYAQNYVFELDRTNNRYTLTVDDPEIKEIDTAIKGKWKVDPENGLLEFSLTDFEILGKETLMTNAIAVSVQALPKGTPFPTEAISLLTVTDQALREFTAQLPIRNFDRFLKQFDIETEERLFTVNDEWICNPVGLEFAAKQYKNALNQYLRSNAPDAQGIALQGIYVYHEINDIYIMIPVNNGAAGGTRYSFTLPADMIKNYHEATYENGKLSIHKPILEQTVAATCTSQGSRIYRCTTCEKSYSIATPQTEHTIEMQTVTPGCEINGYRISGCINCSYFYKEEISAYGHIGEEISIPVITEDLQQRNASLSLCSRCRKIDSLRIPEYPSIMFGKQDANGCQLAWVVPNTKKHLIIPQELYEYFQVSAFYSEFRLTNINLLWIPQGVQTLAENNFVNSGLLQTLVIPSTLQEIKNTAFDLLDALRTVYYCGTEEMWVQVKLNDYALLFAECNIIFCPDGIAPGVVSQSVFELEIGEEKLAELHAAALESDALLQAYVLSNENASLITAGKIGSVLYDEVSYSYQPYLLIEIAGESSYRRVDVYAERVLLLSNGTLLLYTPDGYGLIAVTTVT